MRFLLWLGGKKDDSPPTRDVPRIDLSKPRWDQSTFQGRARHFFAVTDPLTVFASSVRLDHAKELLEQYEKKEEPDETTVNEIWKAKKLYDSAFHPDTGQKNFIIGRMSFQVPGNMSIVGAMLSFYKTTPAVIFWQWMNQTFNATVNYVNRNATATASTGTLLTAYLGATGGATATALFLNRTIAKYPALSTGLAGRLVPFVSVVAGNSINIPLMRQSELREGIIVSDADGNPLPIGKSKKAARKAIVQVTFSRIAMAAPYFTLTPVITNIFVKRPFLTKHPSMTAPFQIGVCGAILTLCTPLACAIFPQTSSLKRSELEPELQEALADRPEVDKVYFNKGL